MNKRILLICAISSSLFIFGQKTSNRNLTSPFANSQYVSGAFSSVINKTEDSFQIIKDEQSDKYALLYEESDYATANENNISYNPSSRSKKISRSIIFNNKTELLNFYTEIENSFKKNIYKNEVSVGGKKVVLSYPKLPFIPSILGVTQTLEDGSKSASFGLSKNRWKELFAEVK